MFARPMSARALLLWAIDDKPMEQHAFRPSLFAETQAQAQARSVATPSRAEEIDRISLH
jgi:hypothetical protein